MASTDTRTSRASSIAKIVAKEIAAARRRKGDDRDLDATLLPSIRATVAADLGGDGALYYGTVDPLYYRAIGLARPLLRADGTDLVDADGKCPVRTLRAAAKRRRDGGGRLARWDVLAASTSAALGRKVSVREVKTLFEAAGGDLDASYTGRGTRVGAPATYDDLAAAIEDAIAD